MSASYERSLMLLLLL